VTILTMTLIGGATLNDVLKKGTEIHVSRPFSGPSWLRSDHNDAVAMEPIAIYRKVSPTSCPEIIIPSDPPHSLAAPLPPFSLPF